MNSNLILRAIRQEDAEVISAAFKKQDWNKPITQFQAYFDLQTAGIRDVIVAELDNEFAGYLTINWISDYRPFREQQIPEIVDFNVLQKLQRQGIGTQLMDKAEERIKKKFKYAGIGFGVYKDYGAAQILYIKRNYIPDGNGLVKNSRSLKYGEEAIIDDDIVFYLTKEL